MAKDSQGFASLQRQMIGHGALMIFMTLIAGLGLWMSLQGGFEIVPGKGPVQFPVPGYAEGWARAHRGAAMNGLMVIAVAWALSGLDFSERAKKLLGWGMIGTGWANTLFYFFSIFSPNRGLSFGPNRFGQGSIVSVIALGPAYVFGILSMVILLMIAVEALRPKPT